jgi:hypothetical protein
MKAARQNLDFAVSTGDDLEVTPIGAALVADDRMTVSGTAVPSLQWPAGGSRQFRS